MYPNNNPFNQQTGYPSQQMGFQNQQMGYIQQQQQQQQPQMFGMQQQQPLMQQQPLFQQISPLQQQQMFLQQQQMQQQQQLFYQQQQQQLFYQQQQQQMQQQQLVFDYNNKQNQLNGLYVNHMKTKEALVSKKANILSTRAQLEQQQRQMQLQLNTGQQLQFGLQFQEQLSKINKTLEEITVQLKSIGADEEKCYETEVSLYQQQQQLSTNRQLLGSITGLVEIEKGLLQTPEKPTKQAPPQYGMQQSFQQTSTIYGDVSKQTLYGTQTLTSSTPKTWSQPHPDAKGAVVGEAKYDESRAKEDAAALRKAMKGLGCDKAAVVKLTGNRTFAQRQMIVKAFVHVDGKGERDLLHDLKDELGGDLERLVLPLYMKPGEFDANLMKKSMDGVGYDTELMVEVLCTRTNKEIEDMKTAWKETIKTKQSLEERVGEETKKLLSSGHFRTLCLKILEAKRPPSMKPDETQVQTDAEELNQLLLGNSKVKDVKTKFVEVFTERSWAHIGAMVGAFQAVSKKWTMDAAIRKEFGDSSDTAIALCTIADFCVQPYDYWAGKLRAAMKGLGTDDAKLIRVVVSRCEVDMANIAQVFGQRHGDGKTLKNWIENDTSGAYRQLLLLLCGYE